MDSQHDEKIQFANDCRQIFKETVQGQRIMEHLKKRFHCETTTFICLDGQPMITVDSATVSANEGQRSVVLYLESMAEVDVNILKSEKESFNRYQYSIIKRRADIGV